MWAAHSTAMAKATRQVRERIKACDLVIEVRDARVPTTSVNKALDALLANKPRLILFNKVDLADPKANALLKLRFKVSRG